MAHGQMLGKDEIIKNLLLLDEEIYLTFNNDDYYNIIIVGGSALVLIDKISRATMDIDTISCSDELKPFMERYNINNNVVAYSNNFPDDYLERCKKLDVPTKKILIYTASLEDIVISKLFSPRLQDKNDICNPRIVAALDWDLLDKIVNSDDFRDNILSDHAYKMFMHDYHDYREEMRK